MQENLFLIYFSCKTYQIIFSKPLMPQTMRLALADSLSFNPTTKEGGARGNFKFSKFRKLKINSGLTVNAISYI